MLRGQFKVVDEHAGQETCKFLTGKSTRIHFTDLIEVEGTADGTFDSGRMGTEIVRSLY